MISCMSKLIIYIRKNEKIVYILLSRKEEWYMANISLEDAKSMMSEDALSKLKEMVTYRPIINMDAKVNNDILMAALCIAVNTGVIKVASLDEKIIKLLNSSTNTLSSKKLGDILTHIRRIQPKMACVVDIKTPDMKTTVNEWVFTGPNVSFVKMFEFTIDHFNITPQIIRQKMTKQLKSTIVNNVAQLVARYKAIEDESEKEKLTISISTVTRLVNMSDHLLIAEFKPID